MKQIRDARIMLWMVSGLLAFAWGNSSASERAPVSPSLVSLEIVDDHGHVFATYPTHAAGATEFRAFLEARPETQYRIRARNLSGERVGIVIAVDGRNIISGERSELASGESMYVLEPHQGATYSGWRTSQSQVNRFFFTTAEESYSSRIGDESAIGVIAAAVYRAQPSRSRKRQARIGNAAPAPTEAPAREDRAESQSELSADAGTGFGDSEHSQAVRVTFLPQRQASQRSFFKYEWPEQLCARGVKSCEPPNRFWPEPWSDFGFVPYPPGEAH